MRFPTYRKHSSGQARVTIAGKDYLLGPYGSKESKNLYKRLVAEYMASDQSKSFGTKPGELSISELLTAYLRHCKKYYGVDAGSEVHRLKPVMRVMKVLYGGEPVSSFGSVQFKAVRQHLSGTGNRTRNYINALMRRVKRMFVWAVGESMVPPEIVAVLKAVDPLKQGRTKLREADPITPVADEVVNATLSHLSPVVVDMVRFQRLVGCRPGEVCIIQPSMVDRSGEVWLVHLDRHKTAWRGKKRIILVGSRAQEVLRPYLLRAEIDFCFKPVDSEKRRLAARHDARVTPMNEGNKPGSRKRRLKAGIRLKQRRAPGESYTTGSYGRSIARACDKAFPPAEDAKLNAKELKAWRTAHRWSPNQLRHTFATDMRRREGIEVASVLIGHANLSTSEIYAEADMRKAIEVVRRIG